MKFQAFNHVLEAVPEEGSLPTGSRPITSYHSPATGRGPFCLTESEGSLRLGKESW